MCHTMDLRSKMTDEQKRLQMVVVSYLGYKLGVTESWFNESQDFLFGKTPTEIVLEGEGKILIEWLEERLGLRPGVGF
jgi:hypothetical protein